MTPNSFNWPRDRCWKDVAYESIPKEFIHARTIWLVGQMHDTRLVKVGPVETWDGVAAWFRAMAQVKAEDEGRAVQLMLA